MHVVVLKAAFCEKERTHRELRQPRRCWRGEISNEAKTEGQALWQTSGHVIVPLVWLGGSVGIYTCMVGVLWCACHVRQVVSRGVVARSVQGQVASAHPAPNEGSARGKAYDSIVARNGYEDG